MYIYICLQFYSSIYCASFGELSVMGVRESSLFEKCIRISRVWAFLEVRALGKVLT